MTGPLRTIVETGLIAGFIALVCLSGWAIEHYESSRVHARPRATSGSRRSARSRRDPHTRDEIHAAYCDWRGIRTLPTLSTAVRRPATDGTFPQGRGRGEPGSALGRARQRRTF